MSHNTAKSVRRHFDGIRVRDPKSKAAAPSGGRSRVRHAGIRAAACLAFGLLAAAGVFAARSEVGATVAHEQGPASGHAGHLVRQPAAVTNGLAAWYPLDGNGNDASGNGNALALSGSPSFASGEFGKALSLNGTSQYAATAPFHLTTAVTVSAWVNVSAYVGGRYSIAGEAQGGGNCTSDTFSLILYSGATMSVCNPDGTNTGKQAWDAYNTFPTNSWHLVVGTFDGGTGLLKEYTDGVLKATTSTGYAGLVQGRTAPFYVGAPYTFPGSIDDVRVYSRALSASEVTQMWQGSSPSNCDQYCAGWWKLDEAAGTAAKDSTGNGNAGTLTNFSFDGTTNGWAGGVFGNALLFNGNNDYVQIPHSASMDFTGGLTATCWANYTGSTFNYSSLITKGDTYPSYDYIISIDNIGRFNGAVGTVQTRTLPFSQNVWHLVTLTYDGSTEKLYIDGTLRSSATGPGALHTSSGSLWISNDHRNVAWNGSIDDVRVYSRALTDYEVYDQYAAGRSN